MKAHALSELSVVEPSGLRRRLEELFPGVTVVAIEPLGSDEGSGVLEGGLLEKVAGYGVPVRVLLRSADGSERSVVFRRQRSDEYGHDRRADRAAAMLLDFDTFGLIPEHVRALDVGAIDDRGELKSLCYAGEFYSITTWASGELYATRLRKVVQGRHATNEDLFQADLLARYLSELHHPRLPDPVRWRRAVRDLVGHGEGVFGIIDGYPPNTPAAPFSRLRRLEHLLVDWRWRLKDRHARLTRIHGDFHPFNILIDGDRLGLLDASRGCVGDPADDVTALAINYLFFALDAPAAWPQGLKPLWDRFWTSYLASTHDDEVLEVGAPYFAWRALVVSNPRFYPALSEKGRDHLLDLAETFLVEGSLDLSAAERLFDATSPGAALHT